MVLISVLYIRPLIFVLYLMNGPQRNSPIPLLTLRVWLLCLSEKITYLYRQFLIVTMIETA